MAFSRALALLAVATILCSSTSVDARSVSISNLRFRRPDFLPLLPLALKLPGDCGSVYQVLPGDTCQSVANYAGISVKQFQRLNPLTLCGILPLVPGWPVCSGDKLAFCSNRFVTSGGDSCTSIANTVGDILALQPGASCSSLDSDVDVCIAPAANACAVDTLCGVSISPEMQDLFATVPDYCTVVSACEAPLTAGINSLGLESLTLTLTEVTPSVNSVLGNDGHPELQAFADTLDVNPAQLAITFTPGASSDGSNVISFVGSVAASSRRKLLQSSYPPTGTIGTPRKRYYGR
jgi:hypothetical protein